MLSVILAVLSFKQLQIRFVIDLEVIDFFSLHKMTCDNKT